MDTLVAVAVIVAGYLIGSVPVAYLASRASKGVDIRDVGSGNTGASNVWQSVSHALVVPVGLAQIGQGLAAVMLAKLTDQPDWAQAGAGVAAVAGHNWSPWLRFAGGRGVGATIGVLLALSPVALAAFVVIALAGVALKAIPQFVGLGIVASPFVALVTGESAPVVSGCGLLAALVLLKRALANGPPEGDDRPTVLVNRLMFDRDIRDREAWVRRGIERGASPPGPLSDERRGGA